MCLPELWEFFFLSIRFVYKWGSWKLKEDSVAEGKTLCMILIPPVRTRAPAQTPSSIKRLKDHGLLFRGMYSYCWVACREKGLSKLLHAGCVESACLCNTIFFNTTDGLS